MKARITVDESGTVLFILSAETPMEKQMLAWVDESGRARATLTYRRDRWSNEPESVCIALPDPTVVGAEIPTAGTGNIMP
jgi:hypothetical protein